MWRTGMAVATGLALSMTTADAQQQSAASIEKLLTDGWEVAGYVSAWRTAR
jgi:hypothetical protein